MKNDFMADGRTKDPASFAMMDKELRRMREGIELIPSENVVSKAVLQALGSVFTNKYSEGYPHKRYYGGNEVVDEIEDLAIARAKQLFGCEHVNMQPYSGSPANMAVFFATMNPGDIFMGLDLSCGGHLTHGSPVNFSGKWFKCVSYGVEKDTELLNMDAIRKQAGETKPKVIVSGLTAYPRKLDFKAFQDIAEEVGAYHMSDISHIAGLVAGGAHESPVPSADIVTTTTHKTLRGPRGAMIMCKEKDRLHPTDVKNLAQKIDSAVFPGLQGGPHDHVTFAKAVTFLEALQPGFKTYSQQIVKNARALAEELMDQGARLVTGGTDNHLMVVDLRSFAITGKKAQTSLDEAGITVNKNTIPYDPATPFNPSGIRLGTPAVTTRGFKEGELKEVGKCIVRVLKDPTEHTIAAVRSDVRELCKHFPIYEGFTELK